MLSLLGAPQAAAVNRSILPLPRRSFLTSGLARFPGPARGKRTAQGTYLVGGPETAAFQGAPGCGETSAKGRGSADGHAVLRQGTAFPSQRNRNGAPEAALILGDVPPHALLWTRSLALARPCGGVGGVRGPQRVGSPGRSSLRLSEGPGRGIPQAGWARTRRTDHPAGRTPSTHPAPSPTEPPTHRPGGGRIPASPQRRGLGRAPPAGGRQVHAASSARPAPPLPHTFHRK